MFLVQKIVLILNLTFISPDLAPFSCIVNRTFYNILHSIAYWTQHCKYWKLQKTKQKFSLRNKTFIGYESKTHTHVSLNNFCPSKPLVWSVIFSFYTPTVVCQYTRTPFSSESLLHHWNILMESLAMFITHIKIFCKSLSKW